jgi:hypothetical protein
MLTFTRVIYTIGQIWALRQADMFFMDPTWQRDPVWSKKEKPAFIRSVIEDDSPIPELCIWEREDGVKVPVDGKQRLTSSFGFLDDDFCYFNEDEEDVWYSLMTQEDQAKFLATEVNVLLLGPENDEDEVIAYYLLRNTTAKALGPGEKLKAWNDKPVSATTTALFAERAAAIKLAFGGKKASKRSGDLANSVQYLASFVSSLNFLTKTIGGITNVLKNTTQAQVDAVLPRFTVKLDQHIAVCARIVAENPDQKAKWVGFPPLGKVSAIWVSIVEPELIAGRDPLDFWSSFYETLRSNPALASAWDDMTRKNANPVTLKKQITFAKTIVAPQ